MGSNTAYQGGLTTFGAAQPSAFDRAMALLDPRPQFTYAPGDSPFYGWLTGNGGFTVIDQVPSAISAVALAAAQVPVAATPLTLAAGAGITAGVSIVNALTGATVTGLHAIDGAMGTVAFGESGQLLIWDPTKACARALQFTSVGNDSAATVTTRGYDVYGFPMTETVTLANAGVVTGKKAFKYVASITPAGTLSGANLSVGQSDKFGFPLRVDTQGYASIWWPEPALIVAATGFTAAVTTTASATTGDVRGTYALQSPSDATKRMTMFIAPSVANIGTINGICGVPQF